MLLFQLKSLLKTLSTVIAFVNAALLVHLHAMSLHVKAGKETFAAVWALVWLTLQVNQSVMPGQVRQVRDTDWASLHALDRPLLMGIVPTSLKHGTGLEMGSSLCFFIKWCFAF